jgi:4-hydroxybenzoyl-CoA thioesterase
MTEIKVQTYWSDCDPAGIVYFGNFFRMIEQVEEEIYLRAGTRRQTLLDTHSVWMPRVETHVNFVAPIRNGHAVRVRMDPQFKGEKTVRLAFEMLDDRTEAPVANGYMTVVCVDRAHFKSTPIPAEIRTILNGGIQPV